MPVITLTIDPTIVWMTTGVTLDGTASVTVTATGQWTANPATGLVDADGNPAWIAKPGYNLPGAFEGLLVGKVGSAVFALGTSGAVPPALAGALYLSINDDMNAEYGLGFVDNQGSVVVAITVPD